MAEKKVVVLTGAGISAESGLSTFRDANGLWEKYKIEDVATPMAWARNPALVLEFYNKRRQEVLKAKPNEAHLALVKLESQFDVTIITQNIDDLHERACSKKIIHLHGEILKSRSSDNAEILYECTGDLHLGDFNDQGKQLRPHVVWFHEEVPMMQPAMSSCSEADILLVIGTSLQVYPAASLISYVPDDCLKFVVDPDIHALPPIKKLQAIQAKATVGVPGLVSRLLVQFQK